MSTSILKLPYPISLVDTVNSHGWVALAPWCWKEDERILSRPELTGVREKLIVSISQVNSTTIQINLDHHVQDMGDIHMIVKRWLSYDWDPSDAINIANKIDPRIADFLLQGGGRFLRSSTFYEDFIKTICTINTNWASTKHMVAGLVKSLGNGVFPNPSAIGSAGEEFIRENCRLGFRAPVVINLTNHLLECGVVDHNGNLTRGRLSFDELMCLKGVGPYTASHVGMLEHDFTNIPVDSEVTKFCEDFFKIGPKEIENYFDSWGSYKFLGYKVNRIIQSTL